MQRGPCQRTRRRSATQGGLHDDSNHGQRSPVSSVAASLFKLSSVDEAGLSCTACSEPGHPICSYYSLCSDATARYGILFFACFRQAPDTNSRDAAVEGDPQNPLRTVCLSLIRSDGAPVGPPALPLPAGGGSLSPPPSVRLPAARTGPARVSRHHQAPQAREPLVRGTIDA